MEVLDATSLAERLNWEAKECWLHIEAETPLEKYPAKQHARRVQEKLGVEQGLIYLPGQVGKNFEDSDLPAPFHQRRYFYYMSGCDEPNCHLTYDVQHDTLSLFIPRINESRIIYDGRGSTLAEALIKYDVDEVYYSDEVSDFILDWFNHSGNRGNLYSLHNSQSSQLQLGTQAKYAIDATSLKPAMNLARMIKDEHEISLVRKANDISSTAHRKVLANILKFRNEAQVEGIFLDVCVSLQAKNQAYDPIAASGPNAGTLHYSANNEDFEDRQLMCLDAGCEYKMYASDITRTFPLSCSWPTQEAENIYKLVERMQESCIKRLAPGVRYLDVHILAHQVAIDGLLALGILHNGTKEEIYKSGTSRAFFPHGLGHHVGLDVHDVGQAELMSVRRGRPVFEQAPSLYPENFHLPVYDYQTCHAPTDPQSSHLEEGMIVTVEPGIYFSAYALQHVYLPSPIHSKYINLDVVQRYLPIGGVRIEDDLLITSTGYENLTTAPKGDAMLEIIRSGGKVDNLFAIPRLPPQRRKCQEQPPLLCAPGISSESPKSILRPLARASTMPTELHKQKSVDFEPFEGPSLFSNFNRSMTADEKIQLWQQNRDCALSLQNQTVTSVCGDNTKGVKHIYMTSGSYQRPHSSSSDNMQHVCKKCTILCETLGRLRQNLALSEQSSLKSSSQPVYARETKKEDVINRYNNAQSAMQQAKDLLKEHVYSERRGRAVRNEQACGSNQVSDRRSGSTPQFSNVHGPPQIQDSPSYQRNSTHKSPSPGSLSMDSHLPPFASTATPHPPTQPKSISADILQQQQRPQSQVNKMGKLRHHSEHKVIGLRPDRSFNEANQAQDKPTLTDSDYRRHQPAPQPARPTASAQERNLSTSTLPERFKKQVSIRTSGGEELHTLQGYIRQLEARLKAQTQSALTMNHMMMPQGIPTHIKEQFASETARIEDKLKRLRAKRLVLVTALRLQENNAPGCAI
ncbi:hypothetical protein GQ44DRAFT_822548 [Phaeosphaeriaceae sp. PMI808]|nr:hypothetical protein GQ44DRAFT_822548 [Phaeosphaeriaceae sp. PMI808]